MLLAEIQHKIQNAIQLDFGQIFNESIELFKKVWVQGLIIMLLTMAFAIPLIFLIYIPLIGFSIAGEANPSMIDDAAPLMLLVFGLTYLIVVAVLSVITVGLKAAFFRIMFQHDMNVSGKEDYFYFLKRPYLGKTISIAFAYLGITILATLLCVIPLIYVMVPMSLLIVIYAFNPDLTASNLLKVSFELGNKKWFITFGLIIVAGLLAEIVGMLLCFVGIFFTASFVSIPLYFIYKKVIGFEEPEFTKIEGNSNI
ncbi:hypothetical protein [Psychroserpens jangbogonensis]|uniref:hypothetical protein n=1 Tax=Psychroserpens jangbogonensis TaxID=1484460 RepID=UPI00053D29BA|nr:hypothetical protein [Psychroserpens jangbogonensis]